MKNGRAKGKLAEREVARVLEAWWGQVEPGCKFKPTPMSGGWSTPDVREAFKTSGDLVTTARTFPFCVEVKRREGWSWKNLRGGAPSPVHGWWKQAVVAAAESTLQPLLVFRHNRERWWVMMEYMMAVQTNMTSDEDTFVFGPLFKVAVGTLDRLVLRDPIEVMR